MACLHPYLDESRWLTAWRQIQKGFNASRYMQLDSCLVTWEGSLRNMLLDVVRNDVVGL